MDNLDNKQGFRVLIIGGGNCGLALAHGLRNAGINYTIFERDNEHDFQHRPRDWGMLLHWGAEYLEKLVPENLRGRRLREPRCDPDLDAVQETIGPVPFIDAVSGKIIAEIPIPDINRVSRMKLRRFLTEHQNLNVQFNKCLEAVHLPDNETVIVSFRDGSKATGNLLIGCDGSHSIVRRFLVGDEAAQLQPVDLTMINFSRTGYPEEEAHLLQTLHPVFKIAAHPSGTGNAILAALDIPSTSSAPTTWKFQNYLGWWGPPYAGDLADPKDRIVFYRSWMSAMCEPFRTAGLSRLEDDDILPVYRGQQWGPSMVWDNHGGRVTLAGDAAHSMLPQRGQGLNNALKDAFEIVTAVKKAINYGELSLKRAIDEYESEMKPRGVREVDLSLEQALKARDKVTIRDSPLLRDGWRSSTAKVASG